MLSPVIPASPADNAGSGYIYSVASEVQNRFSFLAIVPDGPAARRALKIGRTAPHRLVHRAAGKTGRISTFVEPWARTVRPIRLPGSFLRSLKTTPDLLQLIRDADVIDLQWTEMGMLIPFLRTVNPRAHIVCTFHDVVSQRFTRARDNSGSLGRRLRWSWAVHRAQGAEKKIMQQADTVVVLSGKDASLLPPGPAQVEVVVPPLATDPSSGDIAPPSLPEILFVGNLARWENEQGLLWFIGKVWPLVRKRVPHARLRVAGAGVSPTVQSVGGQGGIELLGFVEDLGALYSTAAVAVAPLHLGAGVKFKVVEAILSGVPVVTTPVGAEGIGEISWFAGVHEDASAFANSVSEVLLDPRTARSKSSHSRSAAQEFYSLRKFEETLERVYPTRRPTQGNVVLSTLDPENPPEVSVVVPVYNGVVTLDQQLRALAHQATTSPFEVVISDNGSTDATREVAARWKNRFSSFLIVDSGQERGVSYARNEGARAANAAKVLFCDADDIVDVNWVEALSAALNEFSIAGGAIRITHTDAYYRAKERPIVSEDLSSIFGFLPYAVGCGFGVRKSALLHVGGFDGSYPAGHEEADFCWRLQLAGYTIGWCPSAVLDYYLRPDTVGAARQRFYYAKSSILLWTRFAGEELLSPVSFKGSLRNLVYQIVRVPRLLGRSTRREQALRLGWAAGIVSGHLSYRLLGKVPPRQLMEENK